MPLLRASSSMSASAHRIEAVPPRLGRSSDVVLPSAAASSSAIHSPGSRCAIHVTCNSFIRLMSCCHLRAPDARSCLPAPPTGGGRQLVGGEGVGVAGLVGNGAISKNSIEKN